MRVIFDDKGTEKIAYMQILRRNIRATTKLILPILSANDKSLFYTTRKISQYLVYCN